MSVLVDDQLILHLERLAKLKLNDSERVEIKNELHNILNMFDTLENINEKDLGVVAKMVEKGIEWRNDEVANQVGSEDALKNAPDKLNSFFVVPKFIEKN